jgi:hypothetical protein
VNPSPKSVWCSRLRLGDGDTDALAAAPAQCNAILG